MELLFLNLIPTRKLPVEICVLLLSGALGPAVSNPLLVEILTALEPLFHHGRRVS